MPASYISIIIYDWCIYHMNIDKIDQEYMLYPAFLATHITNMYLSTCIHIIM